MISEMPERSSVQGKGAGIEVIFLTKTCVDITNRRLFVQQPGSIYKIPFFYVEDVVSLSRSLKIAESGFCSTLGR